MSRTEYRKCDACDTIVANYVESYHSFCGRFAEYEGETLCDACAPTCECRDCA